MRKVNKIGFWGIFLLLFLQKETVIILHIRHIIKQMHEVPLASGEGGEKAGELGGEGRDV